MRVIDAHSLPRRRGLVTRPSPGVLILFRIDGNLSGRHEAGDTFSRRYRAFLLKFGFAQSVVDRHVFFVFDPGRLLRCVGVFVDDNMALIGSWFMAAVLRARWALEFDYSPDMDDTFHNFLGVKYRHMNSNEMKSSCGKALSNSSGTPADLYKRRGATCATTLPANGLRLPQKEPSEDNPLVPLDPLPRARSIVGLDQWIVCHVRPSRSSRCPSTVSAICSPCVGPDPPLGPLSH